MVTNHSTNFLEQIEYHFNYLFNEHGFEVIAAEGDYPGFVILEAPQCRIELYQMEGEVNCLFGTRQAPLSWWTEDDGNRQWYYLREMLNFIENRIPRLEDVFFEIEAHYSCEEQMAMLAQKLHPVCTEVLNFFEPEQFDRRRQELNEFSHKVTASLENQLAAWEDSR